MQIREIALYSINGDRRTLSFALDSVNIITGISNTGKTALIEILDYCMGRSNPQIPIGIMQRVAWFGVLLQYVDSRIFIARPSPLSVDNTPRNRVYYEVGAMVECPQSIPDGKYTTIDSLETYLSSKVGISPNQFTPPSGQTRRPFAATIRHSLRFCFQDENEITSKSLLFHKQSDQWVAQSIKDTLPYFLGAVQENQLALEQELAQAQRELRRAERAVKDAEAIKGKGVSRAISLLAEAKEVGLLDYAVSPVTIEEALVLLREALSWSHEEIVFTNSQRLTELQAERRQLQAELNEKLRALRASQDYAKEAEGYASEVTHHQARLQSIGLFDVVSQQSNVCPVCSHHLDVPVPAASAIRRSLEQVQSNLQATTRETPRIRQYIEQLDVEVQDSRERLRACTASINAALHEEDEAARLRDVNIRRGRVVGRISLWLESVDLDDETITVRAALEAAQQRVVELEQELDSEQRDDRLVSILNRIGVQMSRWQSQLELEYSGNPARFDAKHLTVVVDEINRPVALSQMGSARNFLCYHLIVHFALHTYFREAVRPVPSFLFLDQVTAGFYPPDRKKEQSTSLEDLDDDDRTRVKEIFRFIFERVSEISGMQVIVTDHANLEDDPEFQSAIVEEWRGGKALVPSQWPRYQASERRA